MTGDPRLGRSIRLFLVDGTPTGLMIAEIVNWTGKVVVVPRAALGEFLRREEAGNAGVYILAGADPDNPFQPMVYVGESEEVGQRLRGHDADEKKDFFERAIVFVSKDENLTKAHARHLEQRLTARIRAAGRSRAVNGNEPGGAALPEADRSDMEFFLSQIELVLPVLGLDILRPVPTVGRSSPMPSTEIGPRPANASPIFTFTEAGTSAEAQEIDGEFIVKAGSLTRVRETDSCPDTTRAQRKQLLDDGTLAPVGDGRSLRFTRDVGFKSPSGAASIIYGGSVNGRFYWKLKGTRTTYGEWREAGLQSLTPAAVGG